MTFGCDELALDLHHAPRRLPYQQSTHRCEEHLDPFTPKLLTTAPRLTTLLGVGLLPRTRWFSLTPWLRPLQRLRVRATPPLVVTRLPTFERKEETPEPLVRLTKRLVCVSVRKPRLLLHLRRWLFVTLVLHTHVGPQLLQLLTQLAQPLATSSSFVRAMEQPSTLRCTASLTVPLTCPFRFPISASLITNLLDPFPFLFEEVKSLRTEDQKQQPMRKRVSLTTTGLRTRVTVVLDNLMTLYCHFVSS